MTDSNEVNLPDFIQSLKTNAEPLVFRPNMGNPGDALIAVSIMDMLEKYEIPYQFLSPLTPQINLKNKCLLINGGAILTDYYSYDYTRLKSITLNAKKVIILPQTISSYADLLNSIASKSTILTREKISYQFVHQTTPQAKLILSEDAVFFLNTTKTLHASKKFPWQALMTISIFHWPFEKIVKYMPWLLKSIKQKIRAPKDETATLQHRLNFFRNDKEKTTVKIPPTNRAYSGVGPIAFAHPQLIRHLAGDYLRYLNAFSEIHTNRLHAAIPAALLGKKVYFYDNASHKCLNVYNHSMHGKFSNVTWMGDENPPVDEE